MKKNLVAVVSAVFLLIIGANFLTSQLSCGFKEVSKSKQENSLSFNTNNHLKQSISQEDLQFNSSTSYNHIETQLEFGYRVPGYEAHDDCRDWIIEAIQKYSDEVKTHNFTLTTINCTNILGVINPDKENIVIFGAHWDTRAVAEKDPSQANRNSPIPGANDGASGVAVLIELARIMYNIREDLNSQFWFVFFDAEDQGLSRNIRGIDGWDWCEGSQAFTSDIDNFYDDEEESIQLFILLDMVGGTNLEFIQESLYTDNTLYDYVFETGQDLGYTSAFPIEPDSKAITDDHKYFDQIGIPSIDLIIDFSSGNENWDHHHKMTDDLSNIDETSLEMTGKTIEYFVKKYYTGTSIPDLTGDYFKLEQWMISIIVTVGLLGLTYIFFKIMKKKQVI